DDLLTHLSECESEECFVAASPELITEQLGPCSSNLLQEAANKEFPVYVMGTYYDHLCLANTDKFRAFCAKLGWHLLSAASPPLLQSIGINAPLEPRWFKVETDKGTLALVACTIPSRDFVKHAARLVRCRLMELGGTLASALFFPNAFAQLMEHTQLMQALA